MSEIADLLTERIAMVLYWRRTGRDWRLLAASRKRIYRRYAARLNAVVDRAML